MKNNGWAFHDLEYIYSDIHEAAEALVSKYLEDQKESKPDEP